MGNLKLKTLLAVGVSILVLPMFLTIFTNPAGATIRIDSGGGASYEPVHKRAYTWLVLNAITDHGWHTFAKDIGCAIPKEIDKENAVKGNFWEGAGRHFSEAHIGYVVEENDGDIDCWNSIKDEVGKIKTAIKWWNNSYVDFLISLGYTPDSDMSDMNNVTRFKRDTSPSRAEIANQIPESFFANNDRSKASNDVLYYIYYQSFTAESGCDASPVKKFSKATKNDKAKLNDPYASNWAKIKEVNLENGSVADHIYEVGRGDFSTAINIGFGIPGKSKAGEGQIRCDELAERLQSDDLANDYATYVKAAHASGVDPLAGNSSNDNNTSSADTCDGGIPVLGWLICSVADLASSFASKVDDALISLLVINSYEYSQDSGIKTAWSAFRILSTVILVGIALFAIIAQIFNLEFMSAYTVKKIVPRLVIAVILIQLSWFLMTTTFEIVNLIGESVGDLIAAPFGGSKKLETLATIINNYYTNASGAVQFGAFSLTGLAAVVGFQAIGGGFGLLFMAITVLIAAVVAFATLVLRKVVLVALLIVAPVALILWILPNTQGWWKKYWELLTKLLLMFPLIMAVLMVGKVFAKITAQTAQSGSSEMLTFFIIFIAYFGPFFLIPSMVKASGTVFAKAAEGISKGGAAIKKARPIERVEQAKKHNIEARDRNATLRGRRWASGQGRFMSKTRRAGKLAGRIYAGTAGAGGEYGKLLRAQEREKFLKEADLQAQMEYGEITKGQNFQQRMRETTALAMAPTGSSVTLNGKRVQVTESMQDYAFSELVTGKKGDMSRQVINHYGTGSARSNKFKNDNAGNLLELAPDVMKGTENAFQSLTVGKAAKMDEGGWRNMSARSGMLTAAASKGTASQEEISELQKIYNVSEAVATNKDVQEDMNQEKFGYLSEITGVDVNNQPVADGGGGRYDHYKDGEKVDFAGRKTGRKKGEPGLDNQTFPV